MFLLIIVGVAVMEDVRRRFAEYKRVREQQQQQRKRERASSTENQATIPQDTTTNENAETLLESRSRDPAQPVVQHTTSETELADKQALPPQPTPLYFTLLKLLLWALLWGFFIEVGFGAIFFITSLLYLLVSSLRGSRRRPWEPSAYSVFNRNFEAIEGTLSAEQFERELRFGPMNVRK